MKYKKIDIEGYHPTLESLIFKFNAKINDLPLAIQIEGEKVKISSTEESLNKGRQSQLMLSPYLAYIFGFNAEVREKRQYLRIDEYT